MTFEYSYEYDNQGRKIKTIKYQCNSTEDRIICYEKIWDYNEDSGLLRSFAIHYYNEKGQKIKRRSRFYFHPFIPKTEEEDRYNSIDGRLEYRLGIEYTYEENKKKILFDKEEYIVEYEPNLKEIIRYIYCACDKEKKRQGLNEHNYDENKNLISEYFWIINDEEQKILNSKSIYEYNANGKKSKEYSYKYNKNGELIEEYIYKYNDNKEPVLYKQKKYEYDDKGILINIDTNEISTPVVEIKTISKTENNIAKYNSKSNTKKVSKNTFYEIILDASVILDTPTVCLYILMNIVCGIWLICLGKLSLLFWIALNNFLLMPLLFSLILMIPNSLFSLADKILMKKTSKWNAFILTFISAIIYSSILTIWGLACLHTAYDYFKGQNNIILAYSLSFLCAVSPLMTLCAWCDRSSKLFLTTNIYKNWFTFVYLLFMLHNLFYNLFFVDKITILGLLLELAIVLSAIFMLVIIPMYLQWKILNKSYSNE